MANVFIESAFKGRVSKAVLGYLKQLRKVKDPNLHISAFMTNPCAFPSSPLVSVDQLVSEGCSFGKTLGFGGRKGKINVGNIHRAIKEACRDAKEAIKSGDIDI